MSHSKRAVLLGIVMAFATPLWAADPVKVPLLTTPIPDDTSYTTSLSILGNPPPTYFRLTQETPTQKFTIGGLDCLVKIESPTTAPANGSPVLCKLLFKTPTQEFTFNSDRSLKLMELTLDNGRKYLLKGRGYSYSVTDPETHKENIYASGTIVPAGVQTGKIGNTPIALYDSNLDGFYTTDKDGLVIGSPTQVTNGSTTNKYHLVQPFSKYIRTPDGIFELQNIAKDGSELTALPYNGPTATLELLAPPKCSGQIIMTSPDANLNVTLTGKTGDSATVIPGSYTLLAGKIDIPPQESLPKGSWIYVTGPGMSALKLTPGAKQTLTLSGPTTLEFQAALVNGKINIKPDTLQTKGQSGETYLYVDYDTKNPPEVSLNVDGKSTILGKMEFG
ncbi:MAG: hypothetical protein FWD61_09695 [Phycisphaerales bacterium]|nr:hypothetical protein [Phycisphaerales bacterium]